MKVGIYQCFDAEYSNLIKILSDAVAANQKVCDSLEKKKTEFCYLHIKLTKEFLNEESRKRLLRAGLECLEQVRAFEAYGIIRNDIKLLMNIQKDPIVFKAEEGEPTCAK